MHLILKLGFIQEMARSDQTYTPKECILECREKLPWKATALVVNCKFKWRYIKKSFRALPPDICPGHIPPDISPGHSGVQRRCRCGRLQRPRASTLGGIQEVNFRKNLKNDKKEKMSLLGHDAALGGIEGANFREI